MKRFVICLAVTFSVIFGAALWFHVMTLIFGFENALVYGIMEVAAVLIATLVWCSWNMISPEKEKEEKEQTVRIELIGRDLFKYEGDRIEKVGSMWEAKDWMEPLMSREDWDKCMAAVENKNKERTIEKLARQIDYRKRREESGVRELEVRSNFAADTYELVVRYENGIVKVEQLNPLLIMEYGGIGKFMQDLERQAGVELKYRS